MAYLAVRKSLIGMLAFLAATMAFCGTPVADAQEQAPESTDSGAASSTTAASAGAKKASSAAAAGSNASADTSDAESSEDSVGITHHVAADVAITLPSSWQEFALSTAHPPAALATYAPPFRLNAILPLQNVKQAAVLQIATSTNPLIGHDANWLDAQMHMPSGSGMSVLDMIFYYFFPPTQACIEQVLTKDPQATFAPLPNSGSGSAGGSSNGNVLQVSLACQPQPTLLGFFEAQLSSGITFAQTNGGPKAFATIKKFYLAPMEHVSYGGMSWYVFEAQRIDPVGPNASTHYDLGGNFQGAQSDYFWAIGAISPFPFSKDGPRANQPLIHVAYASVGTSGTQRNDFLGLLQKMQVKGAGTGQ
jgi:hypothetical protein